MTSPAPPSNPVYAAFVGTIDQSATQRIVQGVTAAMSNSVTHIHLLFQSTGGFIGDGVFLYNFFRGLKMPLTLYNIGGVYSIGVIAYLGATERKVSAYASFMVHRSTLSPKATTMSGLQATAHSLSVDDQRTEAILKDHTKLTPEHWQRLDAGDDVTMSAKEALAVGIATEIAEFSPPDGVPLFNV
jgi:ATP-dependent protease ClpP protease subunit